MMANGNDTGGPPQQLSPSTATTGFLHVPGDSPRGTSLDRHSQGSSEISTLVPSNNGEGNTEDKGDILAPDQTNFHEYEVENNPFAFSPGILSKLLHPKSMTALKAMGGINGLAAGLATDLEAGLSMDETTVSDDIPTFEALTGREKPSLGAFANSQKPVVITGPVKKNPNGLYVDRLRVFKDNRIPERKSKSLFRLMWIAFMDKVLLLLSGAAVISLALGLYQTLGVKHDPSEGASVEWVEGVAIIVAIVIVVSVGAGNDWQKERQFVKLNKKKEDRTIKVTRSGKSQEVSVYDLMAGDICHLEPGDLIPADGIFISGHGVKCDESSVTGESDQMKKIPASDALALFEQGVPEKKLDCFIISGGKVLEGVGRYLITSVGVHSSFGKTMMALREEATATPLQMKLNDLAEAIAKLGGAAALLLFVVLFIRFLVQLRESTETGSAKAQSFMMILITAITVVVVAVPEGLPLAVTLALAFATTRMLKDNNLVRVLQACETMGNATTICSDKTGTLTTNRMTVVAGTIGTSASFGDKPAVAQGQEAEPESRDIEVNRKAAAAGEFTATLSEEIKTLLFRSIIQNSTVFEGEEDGKHAYIGSKTEVALLLFARDYLGLQEGELQTEQANAPTVVQMIPFDSGRKCMGVVTKLPNGTFRFYVKGASEIVLGQCTKVIELGGSLVPMTAEVKDTITTTITGYAKRSLRTIGMQYRDFTSWPPAGAQILEDGKSVRWEDIFGNMTWIGIVGIQDPLRAGVHEAVLKCQRAGVFVRMVTGDNLQTAQAIAEECGIYTAGGLVMEGPDFRKLDEAGMDAILPRLQVLARSSPEDKKILVRRLKMNGETVAVTGDGTNDGPALKMADVGFSMGIAGTEVAKEASSIILMDDNFASIVKALMWGRAVNDAVKKFLQFQLTVNITAVLLTFVSAVASHDETPVLSAVQLLWVNLIMDTFAALALATDPPAESILDRQPDKKTAPLITINMWKMIIGQAIFQLVITFVLNFAGRGILGYENTPHANLELKCLVFNTFVWMQIFNQYNNRRLDNKFNIFEGITRNWFFIGINVVMVGGQVMIIFVGGKAFAVTPLNGTQWAISIILGALCIPFAIIIRLIPDEFVAKIFPDFMSKKRAIPTTYATDTDHSPSDWNEANEVIREELSFLKMVRGGRLNQLRFGQGNFKELMKNKLKQYSGSNSDVALKDNPQHSRPRSNSFIGAGIAIGGVLGATIGKAGDCSPTDKNAQSVTGGTSVGQAPSTTASRPVSQESSTPIAPVPPVGSSK